VTLLPKQKGRRLAELAGELALSDDDLLPLVEAGTLLGLLQGDGGKLQLSDHGRSLRKADESGQRQLLAQLMRERVPLVQTVERLLDRNRRGEVSGAIVLDLMDEHLTTPQAEQTFRTLVNWLRYANIAIYSQDSDRFQRAPLPPIG
jgi:NitT/TauT family transport system ATP-binding protein